MRILAFSDLHEEEAALESLERMAPDFDYVFACGDSSRNYGFMERVLKLSNNLFIIPGNWENEQMNDFLSGSGEKYLHEKRAEIADGLNVVGFGYSNITPFGTYGELTEQEIYRRMSALDINENTLLMLHCPPKGYFDLTPRGTHAGSESILRIIREKKPMAVLFGHVHENSGVDKINGTTLIKLPAANRMKACELKVTNKKIDVSLISIC